MKTKNVVIFGDSLLRGVVTDAGGQRYTISKRIDWSGIERELNIKIENRSRMGATVTYGLKMLKEYLAQGKRPDTVIIEYGGNDCNYDWNKVASERSHNHLSLTSEADFEAGLNEMLDILKRNRIKPVMMTLPPVSGQMYFNRLVEKGLDGDNLLYFLRDVETISRHQELYNNIAVSVALKRKVELVDVRSAFLQNKDYARLMCPDGIHPNEDGEQYIIKAFLNYFQKRSRSPRLPASERDRAKEERVSALV